MKGFSRLKSQGLAKQHISIYHYTHYDTLYKLIESKELRFSRIDVCNDKRESQRLEDDWWRQYYVSCFTYNGNETEHFWKEYGNSKNDNGNLRLCFNNVFSDYSNFRTPYYYENSNKVPVEPYTRKTTNKLTLEEYYFGQVLYNNELAASLGAERYSGGGHGSYNHAGMVKAIDPWKVMREDECRLRMKIFNRFPLLYSPANTWHYKMARCKMGF